MGSPWTPLCYPDSIRLLQVPDKDNSTPPSPLHFKLITTRLSSPARPQYQALSYAWGQDAMTHTIKINGIDVSVRQNLWDFLRHAIYGGIGNLDIWGRYIWIDALCIVQTDLEEKAHQVLQMGEIFETAKSVIVWLGPDEHDNDEEQDDDRHRPPEPKTDMSLRFARASYLPYWKRLWIVQELLLAQELVICYGKRTLQVHMIWDGSIDSDNEWNKPSAFLSRGERCCRIMRQKWLAQQAVVSDSKEHITQNIPQWNRDSDILQMSIDYSLNECSVILDKVYALINIVNRQARIPLQVDYTIDEVMLFYRTLSCVKKVHFNRANYLRRALKITEDRMVKRTCELLRAGMLSEIKIGACFVFEGRVEHNWRVSKRHNLQNLSVVHDHWILHSGSVEPEDLVIRFTHTSSLYLIFPNDVQNRVGSR
ncbi:hypothetical protein PV11_00299 [Exophiala sideris]|uniref:Heterokaryon incompatibility domain-containing protein n=1 Tax=Exophiala sideris TaxID=1016849 RepID=A0A0D1YSX9_9EURO|nr:hypothetical protein PV11_00299 [Exophiala sideris]